jgi:TolB-like protein
MSLLGQLKSRNVFRVGMAYIVAAWVLIQIADIVLQQFAIDPWAIKFIVFLSLIGFPLALWLTWTFALTPEGLRLERYIDRGEYSTDVALKRLDFIIIALLAAVVGLEALERYMPLPGAPVETGQAALTAPDADSMPVPIEPAEPVEILENSVAVLPFGNLSDDPNQDYFSDGLADELLTALTRVKGLNIASRTSSFAFRDDQRSSRELAQALRVAYLLEGTVRKIGNRLRVTVQLIDADADLSLWSDSYDRDLDDIFLVQEEIANAIVAALQAELGAGLQAVNVASGTANIDAYDLYLQGRELFIARQNLPAAWELLNQATHLDPSFARAWETLAATHSVATSWLPEDRLDHDALALAAARRALELDPDLSMPHAVIAMKHERTGAGYAGAIDSMDTAIENDPRNATARLWRGIKLGEMGYIDHALKDFDACLAIDPAYLNCQQWRAEALLGLGRVQEAVGQFEATLEHNFHSASDAFVSYYVKTGQRKMAYLVGALALRRQFAPVRDWVAAIENPDGDHSARLNRFRQWSATHNLDICDLAMVAVAFRQEHCYTSVENARLLWQPDTATFRESPAFKAWVREQLWDFWQEWGLPPQCRMIGEEDFACD